MPEASVRTAIVHAVGRVRDGDDDHVGDFRGLANSFFPSPHRDNEHDVSDYPGGDRRVRSVTELRETCRRAGERGVRVTTPLGVHRTSDEPPWFRAARNRRSPFHIVEIPARGGRGRQSHG